jgi:hypothetical protein
VILEVAPLRIRAGLSAEFESAFHRAQAIIQRSRSRLKKLLRRYRFLPPFRMGA